MNELFFNEFGRLRSGWRFTIFLVSFFLAASVVVGVSLTILQILPLGTSQTSLIAFVFPFILTSIIAIFFGWLYGKIFEDVPFRALGVSFTKNWFKDLIFGLIIGAVSIIFAALIAYIFGGMRFQINDSANGSAILTTLAVTFVIFVFGAINEETLFRGYLLQTMSRAKLFWFGALLTSALFASGHLQNPNVTTFAWINTFLAGIWFAVAWLKTRNLWFPFGVHFIWNWIQGAFLGINVSGLSDLASAPILQVSEKGNKFIGGGEYGIEGGIACTITLLLSTVLIYFLPIIKPTEELLVMTNAEKQIENV